MLNRYRQQVQRLVGYDETSALYNLDDIDEFINIARDEVAAQGQCLRFVTPYQGAVISIAVTNGGAGYVSPVVAISAPDQTSGALPFPMGKNAAATAMQSGGVVQIVSVTTPGAGYFIPPVITITDAAGPGAGATAVATLSNFNQAVTGQEIYEFSAVDLSPAPGMRSVLAVRGISFIWGTWQWSANHVGFSRYMALTRQWTTNFFAPPEVTTQQGQGVNGSLRIYPIPDQPYPMIWDCLCLPNELHSDADVEAIPDPWSRAVQYYAAHLALLSNAPNIPQVGPLADKYFSASPTCLFNLAMTRARAFSQPGAIGSFYGRI